MIGEVGDTRGYKLLPPFDNHNRSGFLRLASIELINESISEGKDIKVSVYYKHGIGDRYEPDVLRNSRIIGFRTPHGKYFYVPEAFVADVDYDASVVYTDQILTINLGLMPKYQPYEPTKQAISVAILKHLGVDDPDMRVSRISSERTLTNHESEQLLLHRKANSKSVSGDVGEALAVRERLCVALERIKALEYHIVKCSGAGCCCPEDPALANPDSLAGMGGDADLVNEGWSDSAAGHFNIAQGMTLLGNDDNLVKRDDPCITHHRK